MDGVAPETVAVGAGFFHWFQKMNVPRLVDVTMSRCAILVQVDERYVRSHARTVVHELGNELRAARRLGVAHGPIDVEHGARGIRIDPVLRGATSTACR